MAPFDRSHSLRHSVSRSCVPVFYRFPDITKHCLKIANYLRLILHSELRKEAILGTFVRYGRSMPFRVVEVGTSRKPVCDFLLAFHCNCLLFLRYSDRSNIANFLYPAWLKAPAQRDPIGIVFPIDTHACGKTRIVGLPSIEKKLTSYEAICKENTHVTDGRPDRQTDLL